MRDGLQLAHDDVADAQAALARYQRRWRFVIAGWVLAVGSILGGSAIVWWGGVIGVGLGAIGAPIIIVPGVLGLIGSAALTVWNADDAPKTHPADSLLAAERRLRDQLMDSA